MSSKQAKKIKKIIGNVSDLPSRRIYKKSKKIFESLPHTEKKYFIDNLNKYINNENTTSAKN